SFQAKFPGWAQLSPLDPSKLFAEAMMMATAEIERRHDRFVDTVIDCLPSLFAFHPKAARPARVLLKLKPASSLSQPRALTKGTRFRFATKAGEILAIADEESILYPVTVDATHADKTSIQLKLSAPCALSELHLFYLPDEQSSSTPIDLEDLSLHVSVT